jgi:uncharacterized protein
VSQNLLLMEQVDVRRADDPDDSRVFTISKFVLPKLKRKTAEHTPGGGVGTVMHALPMLDAFEPGFSSKGLDLDTASKFGFASGTYDKWTFAATLRDKMTRKLLPVRCTIQGLISEWSPGDHTPGELIDCDHTFAEVHYVDLVVDGVEMFAWSYYGRFWRQNGVDIFAEYRAGLGV